MNCNDPLAVVAAVETAFDYRQTFGSDVVIDMYCYRKHGHNESDEPKFTQPNLYNLISKHPSPRDVYFKRITESNNEIDKDLATKLNKEFKQMLQERLDEVKQKPLPYKPQKKDEEWSFLKLSEPKDFIDSPETKISLKDFFRVINIEDSGLFDSIKGEAETLAGLVLEMTKKFPRRGQKVSFKGYKFIVEEIDQFRVKQIKVNLPGKYNLIK